MLEAAQHPSNVFVTLTYSDDNLPLTKSGFPTLQPKHLQDWLKRYRKLLHPSRIRFYAVGEYGEQTERPHYHGIIFNGPSCLQGATRRVLNTTRADWNNCCTACRLVGETWGLGDVDLGTVEISSCRYVAGYIEKKLTRTDDPRLNGRWPEFSRMSNRPGIAFDAMHEVASTLMQFNLDQTQPDVPSALRHGQRLMPLGRYLKGKLRTMIGKDEKTPDAIKAQMEAEVHDVRETAFNNSESFKEALVKARRPSAVAYESKHKIFKQRKTL